MKGKVPIINYEAGSNVERTRTFFPSIIVHFPSSLIKLLTIASVWGDDKTNNNNNEAFLFEQSEQHHLEN